MPLYFLCGCWASYSGRQSLCQLSYLSSLHLPILAQGDINLQEIERTESHGGFSGLFVQTGEVLTLIKQHGLTESSRMRVRLASSSMSAQLPALVLQAQVQLSLRRGEQGALQLLARAPADSST